MNPQKPLRFKLKPFQVQALNTISLHAHVLIIAPTGAGKSLIFQTLLQKTKAIAVIVVPLAALARQQADSLKAFGIGVWCRGDDPKLIHRAQVLVVNPESLLQSQVQSHLIRSEYLVVDEAHTVWQWGRSFRPEFNEIFRILDHAPKIRSLWLTATLTRSQEQSLRLRLPSLQGFGYFLSPQASLHLWVDCPPVLRIDLLARKIQGYPQGLTLVFCATRDQTHRLERMVRSLGRETLIYHAGLFFEERRAQERRVANLPEGAVILATSAFGMGLDFPRIERVIFFEPPMNLLDWVQGVGRSGRGEHPSQSVTFYHGSDFDRRRPRLRREDFADFNALEQFCRLSPERRTKVLTETFSGIPILEKL